jgi:hypothetical protein
MLAAEIEGVIDSRGTNIEDSGGGIRREDTAPAPVKITRSGTTRLM